MSFTLTFEGLPNEIVPVISSNSMNMFLCPKIFTTHACVEIPHCFTSRVQLVVCHHQNINNFILSVVDFALHLLLSLAIPSILHKLLIIVAVYVEFVITTTSVVLTRSSFGISFLRDLSLCHSRVCLKIRFVIFEIRLCLQCFFKSLLFFPSLLMSYQRFFDFSIVQIMFSNSFVNYLRTFFFCRLYTVSSEFTYNHLDLRDVVRYVLHVEFTSQVLKFDLLN
jgi:hypothetical protein